MTGRYGPTEVVYSIFGSLDCHNYNTTESLDDIVLISTSQEYHNELNLYGKLMGVFFLKIGVQKFFKDLISVKIFSVVYVF